MAGRSLQKILRERSYVLLERQGLVKEESPWVCVAEISFEEELWPKAESGVLVNILFP